MKVFEVLFGFAEGTMRCCAAARAARGRQARGFFSCGEARCFMGPAAILWMDKNHFAPLRNHGKPLFVGICGGIIIPGILRWCRILSIHSINWCDIQPTHCSFQVCFELWCSGLVQFSCRLCRTSERYPPFAPCLEA